MTTPTFTGIHTVAVPVRDQDKAKALFDHLGGNRFSVSEGG